MKRLAAALLVALSLSAAPPAEDRTKLVLAVVVDQFRYDYLTRFRKEYTGGFARLLEHGAVFTDAHHEHFPTVTAIGHSVLLSGATPAVSGIVGNEWYDRGLKKQITSVSDDGTQLLGGTAGRHGSSPHNLLVSTLGDELKMSGKGHPKAVGISLKDRAAILPVGRMADGAYWFDPDTGNFVSSTFYFDKMPGWAAEFNSGRAADKYLGSSWRPYDAKGGAAKPFATMPTAKGRPYYDAMERTPYGNEIIEKFAEAAIAGEGLGKHDAPDVLSVSFSSNDYIGHRLGPDAPEVHDVSVRTDRILGQLFDYIDKTVGMDHVIVVMTADHGVAPLPEVMEKRRMPGGRIPERTVLEWVQTRLAERYGEGQWIVGKSGPAPYLNYSLMADKKLSHAEVEETAAQAAREVPHIFRVYTRTQLLSGQVLHDSVAQLLGAGLHQGRAADLFILPEPYWLFEESGTSHGTPFNYDTHVPVILMGPGIRAGRYSERVAVNDIAPTLASLLDVETPSGSSGRVLGEALAAGEGRVEAGASR